MHFQWCQGSGWRASNIDSIQIVLPVVTGTPDDFHVAAVLHGAIEVGAYGYESFKLALGRPDEQSGFTTEFE